jgi:hypothetical protein
MIQEERLLIVVVLSVLLVIQITIAFLTKER